MKKFFIGLISFYQKTLSFDHGPLKIFYPHGFCRFNPTCSQYGKEAIEKHGAIKGGVMTMWRILRCNPWNKGGNDPVK
ncbi:MAG: membrane protein insertion efficiency factor YidD [Patescibacteria group bacterium]|nr:membrane protein insertion efficiency factor YidD [Patescibacteria group bacterium]MDD3777770.1 membrane protein insertion efficiency factor YidD [Patescibacteria group bacterium]MDD3939460.1 membrane protein insertion efficiency factor YidD [Patescibacteria group bacterium]MDD4443517.1 membrane protein insertion efficiency factor YidD [Patescibacteria group bacterium]